MPDEEKKTVDIDTSGPDATVDIEEVKDESVVETEAPLPKLPVARALWLPKPDLKVAAAAWILAGGAHHTGFSQALTSSHMQDFAEIADFEFLLIDDQTSIPEFKKEIRWNETFYLFSSRI